MSEARPSMSEACSAKICFLYLVGLSSMSEASEFSELHHHHGWRQQLVGLQVSIALWLTLHHASGP